MKPEAPAPGPTAAAGPTSGPGAGLGPGPARIVAYVLLAVTGVAVGLAGTLVQAAWYPGGLLLALCAIGGACYGGELLTDTRIGAAAPAGGWLAAIIPTTTSRPEGDFLIAAGLGPYIYLLGGMAIAVMCATMPKPRQPGALRRRLGE